MWDTTACTFELTLLRMCCRYALGHMSPQECEPYLKQTIDASCFITHAYEERLLLLAYQVLSGDLKANIPDALQRKVEPVIRKQLALMQCSREIHHALSEHNIPYVFLKGPALNKILWGNRMMRHSNDLDVLIQPHNILRADAVLRSLGLTSKLSEKSLRFHQRIHRWTTKKDAEYRKKDTDFRIEVHWKTYSSEFILKKSSLEFTNEMYALYLCLHAAKHGWSRMIWLVDCIYFIQSQGIDVEALRALSKTNGITPVVDEAILLADSWLGIRLVPNAHFMQLEARRKRLNQRIAMNHRQDAHQLWEMMRYRLLMSSFCTKPIQQCQVWAQVALGTTVSKIFR